MKHARVDYDRIQDPAGLIPKDEPVFLLRAQDCTAADTVRYWADMQLRRIGGSRELYNAAREHAALMDAWPEKHMADGPHVLPSAFVIGKPPVGLRPRWLVLEDRISEILDAMGRYRSAAKPIPGGWVDELITVWKALCAEKEGRDAAGDEGEQS